MRTPASVRKCGLNVMQCERRESDTREDPLGEKSA